MNGESKIVVAAKCAPLEEKMRAIKDAGLSAAELYLSEEILRREDIVIGLCRDFPFRYAIHAPNDGFQPQKLAYIAKSINAEVAVFHNIYWEDEWGKIIEAFEGNPAKICVENTVSALEPIKYMRRYNIGRCLDIEHLQMECAGVYKEVFDDLVKKSSHIHLTGYQYSTDKWHTHIHHSPEYNKHILDIIRDAKYEGFIVSEARIAFQTIAEWRRLQEYFQKWVETGN